MPIEVEYWCIVPYNNVILTDLTYNMLAHYPVTQYPLNAITPSRSYVTAWSKRKTGFAWARLTQIKHSILWEVGNQHCILVHVWKAEELHLAYRGSLKPLLNPLLCRYAKPKCRAFYLNSLFLNLTQETGNDLHFTRQVNFSEPQDKNNKYVCLTKFIFLTIFCRTVWTIHTLILMFKIQHFDFLMKIDSHIHNHAANIYLAIIRFGKEESLRLLCINAII